ncbi:ubiquitin-like-conjugating enzyme ATG10 isoform X1 [Lytechinus pictus]|uniref:ubiquitin-like-conjugating enzyme ATG10 isoform X1 n=1 Tax=Lytechinus pictus TaxID=7653 RepID=UPI0030BA0E28
MRQLPLSLEAGNEESFGTGAMLCDAKDTRLDVNQLEELNDHVTVKSSIEELQCESCQFEYHIIHSASYNVPVLYFTACKSDGKLLTLDEVWGQVPGSYQERLRHQRWTFITQQEHPLLGRPFFQLHPCRTADLMKSVVPHHKGNYVVTWLSSVGPVVGLELPLAFADLCQAR